MTVLAERLGSLTSGRPQQVAGRAAVTLAIAFALGWVLFYARSTNFGPLVSDPHDFIVTLMNGITFAGLLFIVASGFSLIFGLMRVVNMAHGAFYLFAGYLAYEIQQAMTGQGYVIQSSEITTWEWVAPMLTAAAIVAALGLATQQLGLRWNQGQDLRQALITIALSVIIADQVIAHFPRHTAVGTQRFGGTAVPVTWPGWTDRFVDLHVAGVQYSLQRLVMLGLGVIVGLVLWLWLYRTRTGMVIRAGVDDRDMTAALGVNIQLTFAIAFVVGSALAAVGATVGTSQGNVASGQDGQWLLNSLVVVIVGGMGSIFGAIAGSLLYALVFTFSAVYLPSSGDNCCTQYSIVFTFALVALVLAFRPRGLFGRD